MTKDEFLNELYPLTRAHKENKNGANFQKFFTFIWETFRFNDNIDFQLLSDVLDSVNFDELNEYSAVCLITAVFPYSEQITYYPFYNRFKEYMLTCISEEEFNKHYRNFEKGADDYWKRMKSYGAPEWISGKKPESNNG